VGAPDGTDNLVLVLPSCSYVSGPVAWNSQRLSIEMKVLQNDGPNMLEFEVRDETAKFVARGNVFICKRGYNVLEYGSVMFPHARRGADA
jgi:hypothetical protein